MTSVLRRLEGWTFGSYVARPADLAVFRVLYSAIGLAGGLPVAVWLRHTPQAFFSPPYGLAAAFTTYPPPALVTALNWTLVAALSALLVGWRTPVASVAVGLTYLALNSWAYSLGKINHDVFFVLTPLVLAGSGWGRSLSLDAARRPPAADEQVSRPSASLAALALLIGAGMFTAGWAKVTTGWLDPGVRATYGHLAVNYHATGRHTVLGEFALGIDSGWFWKANDWAATGLELLFLPAAFHRRAFLTAAAVAALFHLGVWLLFDIVFAVNVLVYSAFVRYADLPGLRRLSTRRFPAGWAWAVFAAATAVGGSAVILGRPVFTSLRVPFGEIILVVGAAVGAGYLCASTAEVLRRGRPEAGR